MKHRFTRQHRSKRDLNNQYYAEPIKRIWQQGAGRDGICKVWQQLKQEGEASTSTLKDWYDKILAKTGHGLYTMRMIEYLKSEWRGLADIELTRLNRKESDLIKTAA